MSKGDMSKDKMSRKKMAKSKSSTKLKKTDDKMCLFSDHRDRLRAVSLFGRLFVAAHMRYTIRCATRDLTMPINPARPSKPLVDRATNVAVDLPTMQQRLPLRTH
jgi:hypothetical protein